MYRGKRTGQRLILIGMILLMAALSPARSAHSRANDPPVRQCLSGDEALLLDRINSYRALNGLMGLSASPTLTSAARHHAFSMATFNYFPPDYSVRYEGTNHDQTITWQQNIANAGYPDNTHTRRSAIIGAGTVSAGTIYRSWTALPAYQEVMLDSRFQAIGIGVASNPDSDEGTYWALTFGSMRDGAIPQCSGVRLQIPIEGGGRTDNSTSSALAYDGDFSTAWTTTTRNDPQNAYVWFDLGSAQEISGIEWMIARAGVADNFAIDVSQDRKTWTQVAMKSNGAIDEWRSLAWSGTTRYIRFYFSNPNGDPVVGYLSEVRVFG